MSVEFSRLINIALPDVFSQPQHLVASAEECRALAQRFGLEKIIHFTATITFSAAADEVSTLLKGTLYAKVMQKCSITLAPYEEAIEDSFTVILSPQENARVKIWSEEEEDQEFYETSLVDIGEIVAQYLCLNLNPYPRHPDAVLAKEISPPERENPFSVLKFHLETPKKADEK